jgi:hypothetical protein
MLPHLQSHNKIQNKQSLVTLKTITIIALKRLRAYSLQLSVLYVMVHAVTSICAGSSARLMYLARGTSGIHSMMHCLGAMLKACDSHPESQQIH